MPRLLNYLSHPSCLALIAANLIPLGGVLFFNWDFVLILGIFWAETGIVVYYNLPKLWFATLETPDGPIGANSPQATRLGFAVVSFLVYGTLMQFHAVLLHGVIDMLHESMEFGEQRRAFDAWEILDTLRNRDAIIALIVLFFSHGFSFKRNYLDRKNIKRQTIVEQMLVPLNRVLPFHFALFCGMFAADMFGHVHLIIIAFVIMKIALDLESHVREHELHGS